MQNGQPRVIYISLIRTGSRSIRTTLFPKESTSLESPCYWGKSALEVQADFAQRGWDWSRTYKFTVVRNPWDRLVSAHGFWATNRSFRQWLLEITDSDTMQNKQLLNQSLAITDSSGKVLVDHVARFERLPVEWRQICAKIGRHEPLPHTHKSIHRHYSYYFDEATRCLVDEVCRQDIELFNYHFSRLSRLERDKDHARYLYERTRSTSVNLAKHVLRSNLRARIRDLKKTIGDG